MKLADGVFLQKLLDGRHSFAIIGASNNPEKYGYKIFKQLKDLKIPVYPINPREELIQGEKSFENVFQIPEVDVLNFVVPPDVSLSVTKSALKRGFKIFWYQPGSYNDEVLKLHKDLDTTVIAGQCVLLESMKLNNNNSTV